MPTLLTLPNELLLSIAKKLESERDLSSLCQICHHLYSLLIPHLYQHNVKYSQSSALLWAAKQGLLTTAQKALQAGADTQITEDTRTLLSFAAEGGHVEIVRLLLLSQKDGVNADPTEIMGWTPLFRAARHNHATIVDLLLANGANSNTKDQWGRTPLYVAAIRGQEAAVNALLTNEHINPNLRTKDGESPLFAAAWQGHEGIVRSLLAMDGIKSDAKTRGGGGGGETPLYRAVQGRHVGVVKLLLERGGVDPNVAVHPPRNDETPLWCAVTLNREDIVELLLAKGNIDPDSPARKNTGTTPLLHAALRRFTPIVDLLLKAGANPDIPDYRGLTARLLMENQEPRARIELLNRFSPFGRGLQLQ